MMHIQHNLLVLGSRNAKEEDQKLSREQIRPVQILNKKGDLKPVNFFNDWGKVGVSSIQWDERFPDELFVSVNDEIRRLNAKTREFKAIDLGIIGDIHDIHFLDDLLLISNTEYDEVIAYDPIADEVVDRFHLDEFRIELKDMADGEKYEKIKDRFHCNQAFKSYEGDLCVLIHSIVGWQFYRVLLEMLIKKQGDGGVINLNTKEIHSLKLQSPHSVRKVNGEYWIQDSSDLSIKVFDKAWNQTDAIKTGGFGRGVDFSEKDNIIYVGLSATRKRYLKVIPTSEYHSNRILVMEIKSRKKLHEIPIPNIEQLDNVYILSDEILRLFEDLN